MSPRGWFVTGTDTGVGKTLVAAALLRRLREHGLRVAGMKPLASGCSATPDGLRNEDALVLLAEGSRAWPYEVVNPCAYAPAIAPNLAADAIGAAIDFTRIERNFERICAETDVIVVEGAGGWRVPLTTRPPSPTSHGADPPATPATIADLALRLRLPVVLTVGLRLGCLNHALLTAEAVQRSGLPLAGWVASAIDPDFACPEENLATLGAWLPAPCLGVIPRLPTPTAAAAAPYLDLRPLGLRATGP